MVFQKNIFSFQSMDTILFKIFLFIDLKDIFANIQLYMNKISLVENDFNLNL